jgi:hypothetical protein
LPVLTFSPSWRSPKYAVIAYEVVDIGETQAVVPKVTPIPGYRKIEVDSRELGRRAITTHRKIGMGTRVQIEYVVGR